MSDSEILRNECIQLAQSIEESFSSICAIWDEVGIHNQNTRETIKMEYYKSCKDVVLAHMKRMYDEEDEIRKAIGRSIDEKEEQIYMICDKLGYKKNNLWIQNGNVDIRQNKTLKQQEAIVNDILEKMNEKFASQLTAASQLVDALRADYETLGVPMEDALKDPESNLVEERFQVMKNRLIQTQACIEKRRIKVAEYATTLRNLYSVLGITAENASDELDHMVLTSDDLPVSKEYLERYTDRINILKNLQEERKLMIQGFLVEIEGLWKLLQTPQEDIDAFLANYPASVSNDAIAYVGIEKRL
ncbi:hypothetical protein JH06_5505 [Blastocystis sp. subtype 4]|uniref:hypothetical protein n=1 Tax=Blastocystis sp. subtype 4 TaxID=944170 RepID=UPI000711D36A|nr:hypothetical protein JH06_5505 [Blastocystis sp. subtype 4]KNB41294.1 hypothetical protein JH06_5505 [Blastocystis sp. subtype 4]|eukprot:XP_014524737.1 hypothetical protein JH06_5505 [Blastocystis sp. subtype 4]